MPRKKTDPPARGSPQRVVRLSDRLDRDVKAAAGLDLDVSNLVRMVLTAHLGEYIDRGRRARQALRDGRAAAESEQTPPLGTDAGGSRVRRTPGPSTCDRATPRPGSADGGAGPASEVVPWCPGGCSPVGSRDRREDRL